MTPAEALASYRASISEVGEGVTVRRYSGTGASRAVAAAADILARVIGYAPHEVVGSVRVGDRKVIALNDPAASVPVGKVSLASMLPLRTDDKIVIRGIETAIQAVDDNTRRIGGTLIALEIQVRG